MPKDMPNLSAKDAPDLGSFNWEDPLLLEQQLSDEERMIRDSARAYAQEKLQPRIKTAFNDGLLYTPPSPRNRTRARMPSFA